MSPAAFGRLVWRCTTSSRELELCSPRRLLTTVLTDLEARIFHMPINELEAFVMLIAGWRCAVNIRVDSSINDRLRDFRDDAARRLGRSVSVIEAINACAHVLNKGL
jgi:hypothetical protein